MADLAKPIPDSLDPLGCVLVMVDYQPQMAWGVRSIERETLVNNARSLARAAKVFNVPVVLTSVVESLSGPTFKEIREIHPDQPIIDRGTMNFWEDEQVVDAVKRTGRKQLVLGGLWTEICIAHAAIDALREGYQVYVVTDACGGTTETAHELAIDRVVRAGGVAITWLQFLLGLERAWVRQQMAEPFFNGGELRAAGRS